MDRAMHVTAPPPFLSFPCRYFLEQHITCWIDRWLVPPLVLVWHILVHNIFRYCGPQYRFSYHELLDIFSSQCLNSSPIKYTSNKASYFKPILQKDKNLTKIVHFHFLLLLFSLMSTLSQGRWIILFWWQNVHAIQSPLAVKWRNSFLRLMVYHL